MPPASPAPVRGSTRRAGWLALAPLALVMCGGSSSDVAHDAGAATGHGADASGSADAGGSGSAPGDGETPDAPGSVLPGTDGASGAGVEATAPPPACPASDMGNTALGTDTPDATGMAVPAITYTNVGASGSYDRVVTSTVAPTCVANVCQKAAEAVS